MKSNLGAANNTIKKKNEKKKNEKICANHLSDKEIYSKLF